MDIFNDNLGSSSKSASRIPFCANTHSIPVLMLKIYSLRLVLLLRIQIILENASSLSSQNKQLMMEPFYYHI